MNAMHLHNVPTCASSLQNRNRNSKFKGKRCGCFITRYVTQLHAKYNLCDSVQGQKDETSNEETRHNKTEWNIYLKMLFPPKECQTRRENESECERKTIYCLEFIGFFFFARKINGSGGDRTEEEMNGRLSFVYSIFEARVALWMPRFLVTAQPKLNAHSMVFYIKLIL